MARQDAHHQLWVTIPSVAGELCSGHVLNVTNDETHHIILDKSVPNIRMNTVLQVFYSVLFYLFNILKMIRISYICVDYFFHLS